MLKVGITGGIGSGKSTIAKIFATLGIPVYDADAAAKKIMNSDEGVKKSIIQNFGGDSYVNNELNRTYISSIVFNNEEKRQLLNSLIHPLTIADADKWFNEQSAPYALKEAALLFESNSHKNLDYVIGVYALEGLRIERVKRRNALTLEKIKQIMDKQMDEDEKMKKCDFIIDNSERISLIEQVITLHEKLLKLNAGAVID